MKLPPINATVLTVTLAVCCTAIWCVERIRSPDRQRYQYFEDNSKSGHHIVQVDTITGQVSRRATSGRYAGNFYREQHESVLHSACQLIADVIRVPLTAIKNTPADARLASNWKDINWQLTLKLVVSVAVTVVSLIAIARAVRWVLNRRGCINSQLTELRNQALGTSGVEECREQHT